MTMTPIVINSEPERGTYLPVHTSDRAVFQRCARKWYFSSPMHLNLTRKPSALGIAMPLVFGTMIHTCLENYYNPGLSRDPVETFRTEWYTHLRELEEDITGIEFMEWWPEWEAHRELGIGMMEYYKKWAEKNDNFRVVSVEHDFYVPLGINHPVSGLPVYYKGRMDAIIQDLDTGRYGVIDHKTAGSVGDSYWAKLATDEQITSYIWAAQLEAQHYDLEYKTIDFVYYNVLPKKFPTIPTFTYGGKALSLDRQKESTTQEYFKAAIIHADLHDWFENNEKAQIYYNWLGSDENQYVYRKEVRRNKIQILNAGDRIMRQVKKMINEQDFDPNFTGEFFCTRCDFRTACLQMEDGSDPISTLENNFVVNADRDPGFKGV